MKNKSLDFFGMFKIQGLNKTLRIFHEYLLFSLFCSSVNGKEKREDQLSIRFSARKQLSFFETKMKVTDFSREHSVSHVAPCKG